MTELELLHCIIDSLKDPLVYVDNDHVIRYANKAAAANYAKWGDILNRSIFNCHNERSREIIRETYSALEQGEDERLITDNEKHKVYMRAVRDKNGQLIGYYERYEPPHL
ncbi:MAG: PAS domain-containing protein [Armatimonadota bacterium]|nr:PAS domain-containing protein [bacterium]